MAILRSDGNVNESLATF